MLFIDILGYISIVFSIIAFASHTINKSKIYGIIANIFFGINIYFYKGYNGLFVVIISTIIKVLSFYLTKKQINIFKYSSPIIAFLYYFVFNTEGYVGLLPSISLIFIIVADLQKNILKMKYIYYGSAFSWLIYGIILNSIPAILFDIFGIITLTYTIFKLKLKKNK